MGEYCWIGSTTYNQVLNAILSEFPDFSYDKLDKHKSYTIGFRHSEFHPLNDTKTPHAWFIQSADLSSLEIKNNENIGLPIQQALSWNYILSSQMNSSINLSNDNVLSTQGSSHPTQGSVNFTQGSLPTNKLPLAHEASARVREILINTSNTALTKYLETGNKEIHYGYIFRSKTGRSPDLTVESELLKHIRQLVYNLPKPFNTILTINELNRMDYVVLRAFMNPEYAYEFIQLFPQFRAKYNEYTTFFENFTQLIILALQNDKKTCDSLEKAVEKSRDKEQRQLYAASVIVKHLRIHYVTNHEQWQNLISEFLMNQKYLNVYFSCLRNY
jgi:hypothetical protein